MQALRIPPRYALPAVEVRAGITLRRDGDACSPHVRTRVSFLR